MFPYAPRKDDELELRKGEMFLVLERCQDGWFKGTSMHTGKIGVFPGNYMSPVSRLLTCTHTHTHPQLINSLWSMRACSFRTPPGGSQAKVHMSTCTPAGRGITIVSPSSATILPCPDFTKPLTCCSGSVPAVQPAAVVTAPQTATGQQPKGPVHVSSQMTVNQARNAVRTGEPAIEGAESRRAPCLTAARGPSSSVPQPGPAHSGGDAHPVCSRRHLPATPGCVCAAAPYSGAGLREGRGGDGLRRCLPDPAQCQRRLFGE